MRTRSKRLQSRSTTDRSCRRLSARSAKKVGLLLYAQRSGTQRKRKGRLQGSFLLTLRVSRGRLAAYSVALHMRMSEFSRLFFFTFSRRVGPHAQVWKLVHCGATCKWASRHATCREQRATCNMHSWLNAYCFVCS